MRVGVDDARHQRDLAQVDLARIARVSVARPDRHDTAALDRHGAATNRRTDDRQDPGGAVLDQEMTRSRLPARLLAG